jgi:hypothetical protein
MLERLKNIYNAGEIVLCQISWLGLGCKDILDLECASAVHYHQEPLNFITYHSPISIS